MKTRVSVYLEEDLIEQLTSLADRRRLPKSPIVEAALASFLSPDGPDRLEAAFTRRLDHMSRQIERVERDLGISVEAFALFLQSYLTTAPVLTEAAQEAAREKAARRYENFIRALGKRLANGRTLLREISEDIRLDSDEIAASDGESFHA